ncbi:MAG: GreA/GreB family elongation factor, partial [Clostridia bacterium]|nr:GreA/GreB family elongation factor [Clostridia bacterium]
SDESPIGKALLGKHEGDEVTVETPSGIMQVKILTITK